MSDRKYCVYKHTSPSNKVYIGITINPKRRWNKSHYKYNEHFNNAINKYGWDNFNHEILFSNLTIEDATKTTSSSKVQQEIILPCLYSLSS